MPRHQPVPDERQPADQGIQGWSVEIWEDSRGRAPFDDWLRGLTQYEQAVVTAAVQNVLQPLGISICDTEWGKNLKQGLYEFRIRLSLHAVRTWGQPDPAPAVMPGDDVTVLLRLFLTFHGSKIVLLFHGYNKGKDPSERRQNREIKKARKALAQWKASS